MLCVNSVQRRFQISDYKFFQSDTAPYESRKHSVAEISQQITTGPKCARTDYKHEGEKSEALEMCIRILLGPQKTCRQITKQNMLCPLLMRQGAALGAGRETLRPREGPEGVGLSWGSRRRQPGTPGGRDVAQRPVEIVRARRWWRHLRRRWASAAGSGVLQQHGSFERRICCSDSCCWTELRVPWKVWTFPVVLGGGPLVVGEACGTGCIQW